MNVVDGGKFINPQHNTAALYIRESIRQRLQQIMDYPLTVVEAPMGYGKTTAVKEYLKTQNATVLWKTITGDSVSTFWQDITRLFGQIDSACAEYLAGLEISNDSIFMEEAIERIEMVEFALPTMLVIDDYHLLSSLTIDRFIELLVKSDQENFHIVIISRGTFGENVTELALKGYCCVIDKGYFEFTQGEIIAYYALCGIVLRDEEATALYTYTEGWISAIYLCMLSLLQEGRVEARVSLHELIARTVYEPYSAELQEFLLHICIFDSFTLLQAKVIWHRENAEVILNYLMANNGFIAYDNSNKTYHIHSIFISYLRQLLGKREQLVQQAIYRAGGEWFLSVQDYIAAMDYFYVGADFERLLMAVELDKGNSTHNEHKERFIRYFTECPIEIKRNYPIANLLYARKLFTFNEQELFAIQCREIHKDIHNIHRGKLQEQLLGELELIYSFTKYNNIMKMSKHHRNAYELLRGPSRLFDNNASWTFGSPSILYMFYRRSGELAQEVNEMLEAMPHYYQIASNRGYGAEYVMQAERHYYCGEFEEAEIVIHKALYMAYSQRQIAVIISASFLQIRLALLTGDLSSAQDKLQTMHSDIKKNGQYLYVHTGDLCEGFFYSILNYSGKIPAWILRGNVQGSRLLFPSHGFFYIIYGKTLLLAKQYVKMISMAEQFMASATVYPNLLTTVYSYIYVAAAQHKLKQYPQAKITLAQGLAIADPDQLYMAFVENGEYIIDILISLQQEGQYTSFITRIRELYDLFIPNIQVMQRQLGNDPMISQLTARELEIAELVVRGYSNQRIGESIHVAEITVKKALQKIYVKLGIHSRSSLTRIMIEFKGNAGGL